VIEKLVLKIFNYEKWKLFVPNVNRPTTFLMRGPINSQSAEKSLYKD